MTGWLPEGAEDWHGCPVARTVADAVPRQRAALAGVVRRVQARRDARRPVPGTNAVVESVAFDAWLDDGTGEIVLRWSGRDALPGVVAGTRLAVEGTVAQVKGGSVLLNPLYRFESPGSSAASTSW